MDFTAVSINDIGEDAMPRTGVILKRIHTFVVFQAEFDSINTQFGLTWCVIQAFMSGLIREDGITEAGWDRVETLFEFLYEYAVWEDFRLAEEL